MAKSISTALARQLAENYLKDIRGTKLPSDETCGVFFDTDSLLRCLGVDPATVQTNVDGIRFYFAKYPEDHEGYPHSDNDKNKMTLVAVRAKYDGGGTIHDLMSDPQAKPSYDFDKGNYSELNDGNLIPPPFRTTDTENYLISL